MGGGEVGWGCKNGEKEKENEEERTVLRETFALSFYFVYFEKHMCAFSWGFPLLFLGSRGVKSA
jgi:hypothetical protein